MFLRGEWVGLKTLVRKEIDRFLKVAVQTVMSPLVNASLYLVVFGISLSKLLDWQKEVTYFEFLVPGLLAMSALNNSLQNASSSIMISKFHGDLQDLKVVPLSPLSIMIGYVVACIVRGAMVGVLVLALG